MVPPEVSAVSRAPRRPRSMWLTRIVMDERAAPPAAGAEALGQHRDDRGEILARQSRGYGQARRKSAKSSSSSHSRAATSATICCASTSSGCSGIDETVELAAAHAVEQRRAFDQLVARQREEPALGRAADGVARAADALQEARDRARRAELADQVDVADIDAELERGGGHQRLELAALQPLLGVEPALLGEAAVMRRDVLLAEALGQLPRDALGHAGAC